MAAATQSDSSRQLTRMVGPAIRRERLLRHMAGALPRAVKAPCRRGDRACHRRRAAAPAAPRVAERAVPPALYRIPGSGGRAPEPLAPGTLRAPGGALAPILVVRRPSRPRARGFARPE